MPQITSIEPQKKKAGRFSIFLDGKFAFGIGEAAFVEFNFKKGAKLTEDQIDKILKREELSKLQDTAIRFLNYRPRSEKELADHLTKKIALKEGIKFNDAKNSPMISTIVAKMKKYKFINDLEFAKWFVESRIRSHQKGLIVIAQELKQKGIDKDIVETVLKKVGDEKELAKKAVSKKIKRWQKLSEIDFKKKIYQFLLSRGFGYDIAKELFAYFAKKR